MTDLVVTATGVLPYTNTIKQTGVAGGTITAGQYVYKDPTTKKWSPADADSATAAVRGGAGIAMNGAAANQPVVVATDGDVNVGATLEVGRVYVQSDTAGGIMPAADLEAGDYVVVIGVAVAANKLSLCIFNSGVAYA